MASSLNAQAAAQIAIQRKLNDSFSLAKKKNPSFSLRAFAKKLSTTHSALSEILKGKRTVSKKMALRLIEGLELNSKERQALLELFPGSQFTADYVTLSEDEFDLTSEWYYFAILSLCETSDFKADPKWIARRLNIKLNESQVALRRLLRLKLLQKTSEGKYQRGSMAYITSDEVQNELLKKAHHQNLELAKNSLKNDSLEIRDFTTVTMAIDPLKLPIAKKMIREFHDKLCLYLETPPKAEVYQLCMQLFPLTKPEVKNVL